MQCHLLAFEGPDPYAQAGGLATRVTGLSAALAKAGFETHLWFVGSPNLPGHEIRNGLQIHRWCQWISRYHPAGVYDGEEGKRTDYARSLPPFLLYQVLLPHLRANGKALVMGEEWHSVDAILHLNWLLEQEGQRQEVTILWNANNSYGFNRLDWQRLRNAAVITTVSRYMKGLMQGLGVEPIVIPNGLSADAYLLPEEAAVRAFRNRLRGRTVVVKVARWDPAKRWHLALETVRAMKDQGWQPLLIARGGQEGHGAAILQAAAGLGLNVTDRSLPSANLRGLINALDGLGDFDVLNLLSPLEVTARRLLFHSAHAVLANSSHEPFGLVGLETMAARGVACIGNTGEDYATPGYNALIFESNDPREFINLFGAIKANPSREWRLRRAGRRTAEQYSWARVIERVLLPRLSVLGNNKPMPPQRAA